MRDAYPATYRDARGEEATVIYNDGKTLQMTLRGVTFTGDSLNDFEPTVPLADPRLAEFPLHRWNENVVELCACVIEFEMPLPVQTPTGIVQGRLSVRLEMESHDGRGPDWTVVVLALDVLGGTYRSSGESGGFEDEIIELQQQLPEGALIRACATCAFSDYSVYGHGMFGDMFCFQDQRQEYLAVRSKRDYMRLGCTEVVQETYLCPEFARRQPGTGYRG